MLFRSVFVLLIVYFMREGLISDANPLVARMRKNKAAAAPQKQ